MVWEKGTKIQVQIEDMSDTGEGIGKTDGFTWFVKDAVIGDLVEAKVMKAKKSYGFARLEQVLKPSPHRVIPPCPVAKSCGGCQLQAMDYEEQLRFKEKKVFNNLLRIGGIDCKERFEPIIKMDHPWHYRNKAQFPVGRDKDGKIVTGFYAGRTHTIIECEDCLIGVSENARILDCIRTYMEEYEILPYDEHTNTGMVRHILIRKGFQTGQIMVCLVINGPAEKLRESKVLVERLTALFHKTDLKNTSELTTVVCSINQEKTNVIMGKKLVNLYGPGVITDWIGPVQYRISPLSFYQVNPIQTKRLYETALEYAKLTGTETVWDLYCGIGTITLFLARKAKKVCGVEVIPQAIEDACANAKLNGIENVEFFTGKAEEVLPKEYEKNPVPVDVIVVDPPRKGCDARCLETIIAMEPKRIVYISCDSATLARDLKVLGENGYEVVQGRMVDMFPWSVHIETVVMLSHKKPDSVINVKVEFGEGEGKVPLDNIAKRAAAYKPKERVTYKIIKEYIEAKYGFKVHTAYIAEVKRELGLPMYDAPNAVEELKQPRKHPTPEKVEAIKDALKHFEVI
ncbi:23S rRNA (uracil(1939)-C(5))-methyltransferase RlmD [Clostridiaceae bacterium]|nr:23S rRNA (uracil(1939)-C(5))-methyltransferase RlmD [Clostridiaceae bacterium]